MLSGTPGMLLENKVAVVSGAGPGLGRAVAKLFAREGAAVVLAARNAQRLEELGREIAQEGGRAAVHAADITRPEDCERLVRFALDRFGRIDVLVQNAFASAPYDLAEEANLDDWRRIFDVNFFGTLRLCQAVIPSMKRSGGGSIVMVNTMSIRIVEPRFGGYASSKSALLTAARTLAKELGPYGIRVNSVVPGYIWGPALERFFAAVAQQRGCDPREVYDEVAARTALGRIPTSEEVAEAVLFFASDRSRAITGQALDVNAGHFFH
ncbi:MAG: short-chain dehydrogenase [Candidatus Binatia bacterium]|nr:MAG: short-chain dehydrogenase [Candidatus Binatia bacterium]